MRLIFELSKHTIVSVSVDGPTLSNDGPVRPSPTRLIISRSSSVSDSDDSDDSDSSVESAAADIDAPGFGDSHTVAPSAFVKYEDNTKSLPASPTDEGPSSPSQTAYFVQTAAASITEPPLPPPPLSIPKGGPISALVRQETLPDSPGSPVTGVVDLTTQIKTLSPFAFAHGGFSDIHVGVWERTSEDGQTTIVHVVVKLLRILTRYDVDGGRARKRLNREVYIWHRLSHPNIAKLFGTSYHMSGRPAMVMQWYQNGSASDFLMKNPSADRKQLVRDVASGLGYLHHTLKPPIVHGDLKGNNVLVTEDFHAVLSDFGLSRVIGDLVGPSANTTGAIGGSVRWQAPELVLEDENVPNIRPNFSSDIWAFACTAYELLTGRVPYHNRQRDFTVIHDIMRGIKPGKADELLICAPPPQDEIWLLLYSCWSVPADTRPKMTDVESQLDLMWCHKD